jgi:hypothetical protein
VKLPVRSPPLMLLAARQLAKSAALLLLSLLRLKRA